MKAYTQAVAMVLLIAPFVIGLNMRLALFSAVLLAGAVGVGLLVQKHQRDAANQGSLVCHQETLLPTEAGGLLCSSCGYESMPKAQTH